MFRKKPPAIIFNNIGTMMFFWTLNEIPYFTMSVTFMMSNDGQRKVNLHYDEEFIKNPLNRHLSPLNHNFYHTKCIPFLMKTGIYRDDKTAIAFIEEMCEDGEVLRLSLLENKKPISKKEVKSIEGNIIEFPKKD